MKKGNIITDPTDIERRFYEQFYINKFYPGMIDFLKSTDYQNWHKEEIENTNIPISLKEI